MQASSGREAATAALIHSYKSKSSRRQIGVPAGASRTTSVTSTRAASGGNSGGILSFFGWGVDAETSDSSQVPSGGATTTRGAASRTPPDATSSARGSTQAARSVRSPASDLVRVKKQVQTRDALI